MVVFYLVSPVAEINALIIRVSGHGPIKNSLLENDDGLLTPGRLAARRPIPYTGKAFGARV